MWNAIKRGLPRISTLALLGIVGLLLAKEVPEALGPLAAPMLFGLGLCFVGLAVGDLALRILQPHVDTQYAADLALRQNHLPAAVVYLGRCVLAAVIVMLVVTSSRAATPPPTALPLIPVLLKEQQRLWPDMLLPSALGAQVEQETGPCPSKHCWSPRAGLHTSREQGLGLGQLTRAFYPSGRTRFDALSDLVKAYPEELRGLSWQTPYDPVLQLRALVLKDYQGWGLILRTANPREHLAMTLVAYNGGGGGLNSDRVQCSATPGCNPGIWFGNVEHTSLKAKVRADGYGKSFFEINREYPRNILGSRRERYLSMEPT